MLTTEQKRDIRTEFGQMANMAPGKLERWLDSPESKTAGRRSKAADPRVGRRVVELKRTKMDDLVDADYRDMEELVQLLRKRLSRRPKDEAKVPAWRATLMNWGHDPTG